MSDSDNTENIFLRNLRNIKGQHQNMLVRRDKEDGLMNESSSGIDPLK